MKISEVKTDGVKRSHDGGVKMNRAIRGLLFVLITLVASAVQASSWLAIEDSSGVTWARVLIVNNSESDSNWSLSGCRTAVASDAESAETDAEFDWDGVVEAGTSEYVWVYGSEISEINIANADGDASAFLGSELLDAAGDGELVIAVSAEGTSSVAVEAGASYSAPVVSGGAPQ
jgi:hypothetical protein